MALKWYQKATVQGAIVAGVFLLFSSVIAGIFALSLQKGERVDQSSENKIEDDQSKPALSIEEIQIAPSQPYVGDKITFHVVVRNNHSMR